MYWLSVHGGYICINMQASGKQSVI
jgi:hypothetical protein